MSGVQIPPPLPINMKISFINFKKFLTSKEFFLSSYFFSFFYLGEIFYFNYFGIFNSYSLQKLIYKGEHFSLSYINNIIIFFGLLLVFFFILKFNLLKKIIHSNIFLVFLTILFSIFFLNHIISQSNWIRQSNIYSYLNSLFEYINISENKKLIALAIITLLIFFIIRVKIIFFYAISFFKNFISIIGILVLVESSLSIIFLYPNSLYISKNEHQNFNEFSTVDKKKVIMVVFDEMSWRHSKDKLLTLSKKYNHFSLLKPISATSLNTFCSLPRMITSLDLNSTSCVINKDNENKEYYDLQTFTNSPEEKEYIFDYFAKNYIYHDYYFPYCYHLTLDYEKCSFNSFDLAKNTDSKFYKYTYATFKNILKFSYLASISEYFQNNLNLKYPFINFTTNSRKTIIQSLVNDVSSMNYGFYFAHFLIPHMPYFMNESGEFSNDYGNYEGNIDYTIKLIEKIIEKSNFRVNENLLIIFTSDHINRLDIGNNEKNLVPFLAITSNNKFLNAIKISKTPEIFDVLKNFIEIKY